MGSLLGRARCATETHVSGSQVSELPIWYLAWAFPSFRRAGFIAEISQDEGGSSKRSFPVDLHFGPWFSKAITGVLH